MDTLSTVNISTARKNFSTIVNKVFLEGDPVMIMKGKLPMVKIVKITSERPSFNRGKKKLDLTLFGYLKDDKRDSVTIAKELRKKAERRF